MKNSAAPVSFALLIGVLCCLLSLMALDQMAIGATYSADSAGMPMPVMPETLHPLLITTAPVIDGNLNEDFWERALHVGGFITFLPDFDVTPKEQTEVRLAYDAENIYFAFRCYDDVASIKASVSPRDKMAQDDFICINLDASNDQQGLTAFYVNPLGIQGDSRFANGNEDFSPDFVWYSGGKIDSLGYTVEVQLPLKSLRYAKNDPTVMGVILERNISRRSEHSTFPRLDPAKGFALLTQMYPVSYAGVEHYTLFELLPTVTATRQEARNGPSLERSKQEGDVSLTAKYGITSDLILDGTINPDFSQVESDAGQVDVNLRFSLFYPEKRPFFLEGQDNFNLGASSSSFDPTIYYSRTIADPLVGTRLTGKLGTANTIAALYAVDNVLESDRATLGRYVHVPILRYKRTLSDDSYVGLLYSGRELEESHNRVLGVDEQYRVSDGGVLESNAFASWAKDHAAGSVITGYTYGLRFANNARGLVTKFGFRDVSQDFRADMGFLTRTGVLSVDGFVSPRFYPQSSIFQRIEFEFGTRQTRDRFNSLWETSNDVAFNLFFSGNWLLRTRFNYSTESFDARTFQTSGVHSQLRGQLTKRVSASVLYRRLRSIYYPASEQGKSTVVSMGATLQPTENFQVEGSFTFADFHRDIDELKLYDVSISRLKLTYQINQYVFVRGIGQFNDFRRELTTDLLASFTYIPGTAVYLGYGSVFDKVQWNGSSLVPGDSFLEVKRGLFLKMSYLWRS